MSWCWRRSRTVIKTFKEGLLLYIVDGDIQFNTYLNKKNLMTIVVGSIGLDDTLTHNSPKESKAIPQYFDPEHTSFVSNLDATNSVFRDCSEVYRAGLRSRGNYTIRSATGVDHQVLCDDGWTVILRRGDYGFPVVSCHQSGSFCFTLTI